MNNHLTVKAESTAWESNKVVDEIVIYGYGLGPIAVTNGGYSVEWSFNNGTLTITNLNASVKDINIAITMMC